MYTPWYSSLVTGYNGSKGKWLGLMYHSDQPRNIDFVRNIEQGVNNKCASGRGPDDSNETPKYGVEAIAILI